MAKRKKVDIKKVHIQSICTHLQHRLEPIIEQPISPERRKGVTWSDVEAQKTDLAHLDEVTRHLSRIKGPDCIYRLFGLLVQLVSDPGS